MGIDDLFLAKADRIHSGHITLTRALVNNGPFILLFLWTIQLCEALEQQNKHPTIIVVVIIN